MKRFTSLALATMMVLSLVACGGLKEMSLEDFGLGNLAASQVEIAGEGGATLTVDCLEMLVEETLEVELPLPEIAGLVVSVTAEDGVAASVSEDGVLTLTGAAPTEGALVTLTFTADKYAEGSFLFVVKVLPRTMEVMVVDVNPTTGGGTPDTGGSAPDPVVTPVEECALQVEKTLRLHIDALEGATLEVTDQNADQGFLSFTLEQGVLTLTGLKEGETTLTVTATLEPNYLPATTQVAVTVEPKPAPPPVQQPQQPQQQPQQPQQPASGRQLQQSANRSVDNSAYTDLIDDIIYYTNLERQAAGLSDLVHVPGVDVPAALRAKEIDSEFSHTRPNGSNFNSIFGYCGLSYSYMGENLYAVSNKYPVASEVVAAWMESPGHRANILNGDFVGIGIGVYEGDPYANICQLFVTP